MHLRGPGAFFGGGEKQAGKWDVPDLAGNQALRDAWLPEEARRAAAALLEASVGTVSRGQATSQVPLPAVTEVSTALPYEVGGAAMHIILFVKHQHLQACFWMEGLICCGAACLTASCGLLQAYIPPLWRHVHWYTI